MIIEWHGSLTLGGDVQLAITDLWGMGQTGRMVKVINGERGNGRGAGL